MKISNSKKQLAKIIHENGGWRDGAESAAQCDGGEISFWHDTATKQSRESWCGNYLGRKHDIEFTGVKLPNWHQTILSRDEYFHLYPAPDAKTEFCESVLRSIPEPSDKPTIEQLAADYRNKLDYANRKQQEADAAKAGAEAKLAELVAAGEALGLVLSVAEPEQELVIAVQVGDEVECVESNIKRDKYNGMVGILRTIDESDRSRPYLVDFDGKERIWCHEVKFVRRPTKGDTNA